MMAKHLSANLTNQVGWGEEATPTMTMPRRFCWGSGVTPTYGFRRKRGTANAQRYDMQLLDRLFATQDALNTRSYSPSRSIRFVAQKPKAREIHDVYSNRKGKDTHKAVARLQSFMHQLVGVPASPQPTPIFEAEPRNQRAGLVNPVGYRAEPCNQTNPVGCGEVRTPTKEAAKTGIVTRQSLVTFGCGSAAYAMQYAAEPQTVVTGRGPLTSRLIPTWKPDPANVVGYRTQVLFFQRHFPYSRLSVQRGTEVDTFEPLKRAEVAWGDAGSPTNIAKPEVVGVPASPQPTSAVSHIIIRENGYLKGGLKRCQISKLFIKPGVELCPTHGKP